MAIHHVHCKHLHMKSYPSTHRYLHTAHRCRLPPHIYIHLGLYIYIYHVYENVYTIVRILPVYLYLHRDLYII